MINLELQATDLQKLNNISNKIKEIYNSIDCTKCDKTICGSCLNSIRQSLEYLCLFTCEIYQIKLTRVSKSGNTVVNDNPTLNDMAPLIEKHFKQNNILWSKEIDAHIGLIWILGNLGSHAQKETIIQNTQISKVTIANALNSMYVVTEWFYNHFGQVCPVKPRVSPANSDLDTELINKTKILYDKLAGLKQRFQDNEIVVHEAENPDFENVYFDNLIEAIDSGRCILFIGPDIAVDEAGNSLHEKFYKSISRGNIEYNEQDRFFMPYTEKLLVNKVMNFYKNEFPKQNILANAILQKLAQIPFSLIVSVTPDDTIHRIFEKYNKKHTFLYYSHNNEQEAAEPSKDKQVIFNMLGNAADDGKYLFTHKQFYDYVTQKQGVKIPLEIEKKINDVPHYLFIGIDYNNWYNRLLLFTLNLYDKPEAYSFDSEKISELHQSFINRQFNITFIKNNYNEFVNILLQKCKNVNLFKSLINSFIENTITDISEITGQTAKADSLEKLKEIETKINEI